MSASPKIPTGWRKLRNRQLIQSGDKVWRCGFGPWEPVGDGIHGTTYRPSSSRGGYQAAIIRRVARAKGKGRG